MMILNKHNLNETPPMGKPLLMEIEKNNEYLWTVGCWDDLGWHCEYDKKGYSVVSWYRLPINKEKI